MRLPGLFLIAASICFFMGCSTIPAIPNAQPPLAEAPWDTDPPKTCIALSGGGIRSGAVSLGALQALHEVGLLSEADIIVSVSGGGYPVYGILANAERYPDVTLDDLLSDDGRYIQGVEKNSDFVSTADGLFNGLLASLRVLSFSLLNPFWSPDLVQDSGGTFTYAMSIHKTFVGFDAPTSGRMPLAEMHRMSERVNFPYVIFQASGSAGKTPPSVDHKYSPSDDVFELSSSWIGSRRTGYWRSYVPDLSALDSVVASAAAIDAPKISNDAIVIPNWARRLGFGLGVSFRLADGTAVFVSDGGFAENQAVMPLLERKCASIIALDAAHDPFASMKAWDLVIEAAKGRNWSVVEPTPVVEHDQLGMAEDAWNLPSHLYKMSVMIDGSHVSDVSILKLGIVPHDHVKYPKVVEDFWNRQLMEWDGTPRCNDKRRLKTRCTFPQQATVTQSFSREELRAYRCLGHFMVSEFVSKPRGLTPNLLLATLCRDGSTGGVSSSSMP